MDTQKLTAFFLWCTIINAALLILSFAFLALGGLDFTYQWHGAWFAMTREAFGTTMYTLLGVYKIAILVFNLVPYVALRLIGKG